MAAGRPIGTIIIIVPIVFKFYNNDFVKLFTDHKLTAQHFHVVDSLLLEFETRLYFCNFIVTYHSHNLCSHHLSLPSSVFHCRLKLISFTYPFLYSHFYFFRTDFTDLNLY